MMPCVHSVAQPSFCAAISAAGFLFCICLHHRLHVWPLLDFCATILDISCVSAVAEWEVQRDLLWLGDSKPFWNLTTPPPALHPPYPPRHPHFL